MEQDKLTSTLLTLVSRENRYAESVLHLIRLKKQFYENAFKTMEAELPLIEKMLQETTMRSVFGERLEDHLRATNRTIAFPIALSIRQVEYWGFFRASRRVSQYRVDNVDVTPEMEKRADWSVLASAAHLAHCSIFSATSTL